MILDLPTLGTVNFRDDLTPDQFNDQLTALSQKYGFDLPQPPPPSLGQVVSGGLHRGMGEAGITLTKSLPAELASTFGYNDYAQQKLEEAKQAQAQLEQQYPKQYKSTDDVKDIRSGLGWAAENVAEAAPVMGGAIAAGLAAPVVAGAAGAGAAGAALAGTAATYLGMYALSAPQVFQHLYETTGQMEPGAAAIFGAGEAALQTILPRWMSKGLSAPMKSSIVGAALKYAGMDEGLVRAVTAGALEGAGVQAAAMGGTEALNIAAENFVQNNPQVFDSPEWHRIMDASINGAIVGGVFGAGTGAVHDVLHSAGTLGVEKDQKDINQQRQAEQREAAQLKADQESLSKLLNAKQLELPLGEPRPVQGVNDQPQQDLFRVNVPQAPEAQQAEAQGPQEEPVPSAPAPVPDNIIKTDTKSLQEKFGTNGLFGLGPTAKILRGVDTQHADGPGPIALEFPKGTIDLSNPVQAQGLKTVLEQYANGEHGSIKEGVAPKIEEFLKRPEFQVPVKEEPNVPAPIAEPVQPVARADQPSVPSVGTGEGAGVGDRSAAGAAEPVGRGLEQAGVRAVPADEGKGEQPAPISPEVAESQRVLDEYQQQKQQQELPGMEQGPATALLPKAEETPQEKTPPKNAQGKMFTDAGNYTKDIKTQAEAQGFVRDVDSRVDDLLNNRRAAALEDAGVQDAPTPQNTYKGSDIHDALRMPMLINEYLDQAKIAEGKTSNADRAKIARIQSTIRSALIGGEGKSAPYVDLMLRKMAMVTPEQRLAAFDETRRDALQKFDALIKEPVRMEKFIQSMGRNTGKVLFSEANETATGQKVEDVTSSLEKAFNSRDGFQRMVTVVQSAKDLPRTANGLLFAEGASPDRVRAVTNGEHVWMVADNIPKGRELGVLLHDLGTHIGMENLLGPDNYIRLTEQVRRWAGQDGTRESDIAKRAMSRVADSSTPEANSEVVAYFVEEAVHSGINPTALEKVGGPLGQWFRALWAAAKTALRRIGFGKFDALKAQDVVDLAYGAAKLEMTGAWHGTAADFRNFNHDYMGKGEGAQAYGWGTYLAQRPGIAREYWKADVGRKSGGWDEERKFADGTNLSTDDTAVASEEQLINKNTGRVESDWKEQATRKLAARTRELEKIMSYTGVTDFFRQMDELKKQNMEASAALLVGKIGQEEYSKFAETMAVMRRHLRAEFRRANRGAEFNGNDAMYIREAIPILQKILEKGLIVPSSTPKGSLMHADVSAHENEMLDLDRTLGEQSPQVQKALERGFAPINSEVRELSGKNWKELTGKELVGVGYGNSGVLGQMLERLYMDGRIPRTEKYAKINDALASGNNSEAVSRYLDRFGIKGSKFLDAPSRRDIGSPTRNYVIFNDRNVQRVMSEVGADRNQVRFSEAPKNEAPVNEDVLRATAQAPRIMDRLPPTLRTPVRAIHDALFSKRVPLGVMQTEDLVDAAQKSLPHNTGWVKALVDWVQGHKDARAHTMMLETPLQGMQQRAIYQMSQGERNAVNAYLRDMNVAKKWGFQPDGLPAGKGEIDPAMVAKFNALPSENARTLVKQVFQHGIDECQYMQDVVTRFIDSRFAEALDAAESPEAREKIQGDKDALTKRFARVLNLDPSIPYSPFKRFGDYVVVAKSAEFREHEANGDSKWIADHEADPNHQWIEFATTKGEANHIYDQLKSTDKYEVEQPFEKSKARDYIYSGIDLHRGFAKLKGLLNVEAAAGDMNKEYVAALESMVNELYLKSLAERSGRKAEMQRRMIPGANPDMLRSFFTQAMANAHYLSNLEHNDRIMDALQRMQVAAKPDRAVANPYLNEIMAREGMAMQVRAPSWLDLCNRMTGDWFLTFSPAFYLQRSMQTFMLSVPWLAGRYGYFKTNGQLMRSYGEALQMLKAAGTSLNVDFSKLPASVNANERRMIDSLIQQGAVTIGFETKLHGYRSDTSLMTPYIRTTDALRSAMNRVEILNRTVTALAAYRMELEREGTDAQAQQVAYDSVSATHGMYDGFNTPRLFNQGPVSRSVTQFRRFQVIQLTLLAKAFHNAFMNMGATPEETARLRAMGRKELFFLAAHTLALGGVMGLPIASVAGGMYAVINKIFGDDEDQPKDFEQWVREKGGDNGLLLAKGIPAALGWDVSGNIGMSRALSIMPFTNVDVSSSSKYAQTLMGLMGPFAGGLLPGAADGVGYMAQGDYYKGLEKMLPHVFANTMKAARFSSEGISTKTGDIVMPPSELGIADLALQAAGVPTTKISERQYLTDALYNTQDYFQNTQKNLVHEYTQALKHQDVDTMQNAQQAWMRLQNARAANGLTRQPMNELFKAAQAQQKRERDTVAGVEATKQNRQFLLQNATH